MAGRGEILNKGLLQRLARRLNIGAVGQFPPKLNLDEVLVVAGLGGPYADYELLEANAINALDGLNTFTGIMAAQANLVTPVVPTVDTAGREARVIASSCFVDFDAAGAAAFAGEVVSFFISLINPVTGGAFPVVAGRFTVSAAVLRYAIPLDGFSSASQNCPPASWGRWLPAGFSWVVQVKTDGTNFPANTDITKAALLATVEKNEQPPGL